MRRPWRTWRLAGARGIHVGGPGRGRDGLQRIRPGPAGRTAGDPGRDRGAARAERPLAGRHALVTSGPTHEPIDPVRYIANRSSGRQGHAIAAALAELGRAGDAGQRAGVGAGSRRRRRCSGWRARSRCWTRARRRCRRMSRCSPPRSPTGASRNAAGGQDQEAAGRGAAGAGTGREPRHPRHHRAAGSARGRGWSSALPPKPTI